MRGLLTSSTFLPPVLVTVIDSFCIIVEMEVPPLAPFFMFGDAILIFWIRGLTAYILLSSKLLLPTPPLLYLLTLDSPGAVPPLLASLASLINNENYCNDFEESPSVFLLSVGWPFLEGW